MSPTIEQEHNARGIVEEASKLPPGLRHRVAIEILDTLHEPPEDPEEVKKAWQEELERRVREVEDGTAKTYSLEETMAYLRQSLVERKTK